VSRFADDLIASMKQAAAYARGRKVRGLRGKTVKYSAGKSVACA